MKGGFGLKIKLFFKNLNYYNNYMKEGKMNKKGFTLIELLIVVAIIAILAAIAVPNFLEAQVRSKVSRVKADMRSLATALESYYVDYNKYPAYPFVWGVTSPVKMLPAVTVNPADMWGPWGNTDWGRLIPLTTPVAYITSIMKDVFYAGSVANENEPGYGWWDYSTRYAFDTALGAGVFESWGATTESGAFYAQAEWRMAGVGPDGRRNYDGDGDGVAGDGATGLVPPQQWQQEDTANDQGEYPYPQGYKYDPTNGTVSPGDIVRFGP